MPAKEQPETQTASSQADPITLEQQAKAARFWLENTTEGKAFLAGFHPEVVYMLGETMPGSPMMPEQKPVTKVHHTLGYWTSEKDAEKALRNRSLVIVKVNKGD